MGRKRGGRRASASNKGLAIDGVSDKNDRKKNSDNRSVDDQIAFWKKKEQNKLDDNKRNDFEGDDEDEDIDDEEAFDSEDEKKWGGLFASSKNKGISKGRENKAKIIEKDSDIESEGFSDSEENESPKRKNNDISVSSEEEEETDGSEKKSRDKREEEEDTDDDSEDTDALMGTSDEEDGEEENDGGQYMLQLLENIDKQEEEKGRKKDGSIVSPKMAESEFSSAVLRSSKLSMDMLMKGIQSESKDYKKLQKDVAQLSGVTDRFDRTTKVLHTARTPASRVVTERALRQVHYEETKKDVSQWNNAIHENRNAESLDFRSKASYELQLSNAALVGNFTPETEFEQEIAAALEQAGASNEKDILEKEKQKLIRNNYNGAFDNIEDDEYDAGEDDDALGRRHMTEKEYQKRHAELAKMRALLFYEEQKARHINKIKSKKYRKIRKKQRLKMEQKELEAQMEEDPDLARELEEKEEMERMKERMTLAHKNTSKWAKHQLQRRRKHGASALDKDTKQALSAQLRTGDELRRKMKSIRGDDDDSSDSSNSSSSDEGESEDGRTGGRRKKKDKLLEKARTVLEETAEAEDSEGRGLVGMSFMKKGLEAQRKRAKEEARKLLEELEQNMRANGEGSDEESIGSERESLPDDEVEKKKKVEAKKKAENVNVDDIMSEGNIVAKSLMFGKSNTIQLSDGVNVEHGNASETLPVSGHTVTLQLTSKTDALQHNDNNSNANSKEALIQSLQSSQTVVGHAANENKGPSGQASPNKRKAESQWSDNEDDAASLSASNPWMKVSKKNKSKNKKSKVKDISSNSEAAEAVLNVNEAANALMAKENATKNAPASEPPSLKAESKPEGLLKKEDKGISNTTEPVATEKGKVLFRQEIHKNKKVTEMTQEELVQRAFAAPTDAELEEEFEKERTELSDARNKKKKEKEPNTSSGWGSWAGMGAPPPPPPKRLPKKLQPPPKKAKVETKAVMEKKPNVIVNDAPIPKYSELQVQTVPYPYRSRVEYEAAMAGAIGKEWNVSQSVKDMTRPEIQFTRGRIIRPLSKGAKATKYRAPAKF